MIGEYLNAIVHFVIVFGFAASALVMSVVFGRSGVSSGVKDSAYECGMLPVGDGQPRFSVKFYLVAMLFVIFDIEVVYLYPWALIFRDHVALHGPGIFWSASGFLGILFVAYLYALKKGVLNWKQ
jgi:NADH-quinone oxidoreductase subunit A